MIYLNGNPINITRFPDNTTQVWKLPDVVFSARTASIQWDFENEGEFMHLAQLKYLLDGCTDHIYTHLKISYLPYARQDKDVSNFATFALYPFAHLLNSLFFDRITVLDPHSGKANELIRKMETIQPSFSVANIFNETKMDLACYPDKGAFEKYTKIYDFPHVYGEKVRNQLTGAIESYSLIGNVEGKNVLIIDDICDGGGTFILLAKDLYRAGANNVNLFVTHGIFSKGLTPIFDSGIDRIFTAKGEMFQVQGYLTHKPYEDDSI